MDPEEALTQLEKLLAEIAEFKARNSIWDKVDLVELHEQLGEAQEKAGDLLDWASKGGHLPSVRNR